MSELNDVPESSFTSPPLLISTLGINIEPESKKIIKTVFLKTGGSATKEIHHQISPGGGYVEQFREPLGIPFDSTITISCRWAYLSDDVSITLKPEVISTGASEEDGKQVYRQTVRHIVFTIGIQSLPSFVKEIVASCSRFRVLIIGQSGAGKSTLINKVFGVTGVDVSDDTRGEASIEQEYITSDNKHFVVHDSSGFEAADRGNFTTVRDFISDRRNRRDLKDRLHAVWLCLAIPFASGRVVESGVEEFLRDRKEILGDIPLVVVFTKLDLLIGMLNTEAIKAGRPMDTATINERKQVSLEKFCLDPVRRAAGCESISHVVVSTEKSYEDTLIELTNETMKNIRASLKEEAALYIATIAQRVNMSIKVEMTIEAGEKKYWNALLSSPNFSGHTMKECLDVLHNDIVAIWNFRDPEKCLLKSTFKGDLYRAPILGVRRTDDPRTAVLSMINGLEAAFSDGNARCNSVPVPVVAAIAPVAPFIVLGKLIHNVYKATPDVVKQLMAYIVDLTCVMQAVFLLTIVHCSGVGSVTDAVVNNAMDAYEKALRSFVHDNICKFSVGFAPGRRDEVLEEIKTLIDRYHLPEDEVAKLRRELKP